MKDCNGIEIKEGDIVADTITINKEGFKDPFSVFTVRKYNKANHGKIRRPKCGLVLDGAYCFGALENRYPEDLFILTPGVNMQDVFCHFAERQRKYEHDGWSKKEMDKPIPPHLKQTPIGMLEQIVRVSLKLPKDYYRTDIMNLKLRGEDELGGSDVLAYLSHETAFFATKILLAQQENKRIEDQRKLWELEAEGDVAAGI